MSWHLQPQMIHPSGPSTWSISIYYIMLQRVQHGLLVDRGANGGLAGFDVRILSKSSRKCTVTGIDQHQINGLDIVHVLHCLTQIMVMLTSS